MRVEIIGERKTATNYVKRMLRRNFGIETINQGWKHRELKLDKCAKDVLYIITVKDPYLWLKSLYQKPYHMNYIKEKRLNFSAYLRHFAQDYKGERYSFPMNMWNRKYQSYQDLLLSTEHRGILVRHEDILKDWKEVFTNIAIYLDKPFDKLVNIEKRVNDIGIIGEKFRQNDFFEISKRDLKFINGRINARLVRWYGYKIQK